MKDGASNGIEVWPETPVLAIVRLKLRIVDSSGEADVMGMMLLAGGLATVGLYISAYFSLVYYGLLRADTRLVPSVCRLEERTCQTVLSTRYARVFGLPNSLLGLCYYCATLAILGGSWLASPVGAVLVAIAWFTVGLGLFLAYSLLFIIRITCPLCLASHVINLGLALVLTSMRSSWPS
jgi:uncharacterized membrane protein